MENNFRIVEDRWYDLCSCIHESFLALIPWIGETLQNLSLYISVPKLVRCHLEIRCTTCDSNLIQAHYHQAHNQTHHQAFHYITVTTVTPAMIGKRKKVPLGEVSANTKAKSITRWHGGRLS
jgi:hypothetical protein